MAEHTEGSTAGFVVVDFYRDGRLELDWDGEVHDNLADAMVSCVEARMADGNRYAVARLVLTEKPVSHAEWQAAHPQFDQDAADDEAAGLENHG